MKNPPRPAQGRPQKGAPARRKPQHEAGYENLVDGRNAVLELLKSGRQADTLYIASGQRNGLSAIITLAKEQGCPVKEVSAEKLDAMAGGVRHQGAALTLPAAEYAELSDLLELAASRGEAPFIILADEIEDPHNLGALIRTAEAAGAHGIVIPKRRGVGLTAAVFKSSAGAAAHLPVARVGNLVSAAEELKEKGLWLYGCDMEGGSWHSTNFSGGVVLVVGSEGRGISRLLKEKCDQLVSLPMLGKVNSLNASVAGGIMMYEIARQRMEAGAGR